MQGQDRQSPMQPCSSTPSAGVGGGAACGDAMHANVLLAPWCQQLQLICWQSVMC